MRCALVATFLAAVLRAGTPVGDPASVERTPGLVAFWTFGEEKGPRISQGTKEPHPLETVGPEPSLLQEGPYSGRSLHFEGRSYLRIPYARLGGLNIAGKDAQVSMFAVVRMDELKRGSTIAGIWSEGKGAFDA
ncbi:MAG: hypothetical protein ACKORI_09510 [Verrucomicrobiota bacterium]